MLLLCGVTQGQFASAGIWHNANVGAVSVIPVLLGNTGAAGVTPVLSVTGAVAGVALMI